MWVITSVVTLLTVTPLMILATITISNREPTLSQRYSQLTQGITPAQVEAILGSPPGYYATGKTIVLCPSGFPREDYFWWEYDTAAVGVKYGEDGCLEDWILESRLLEDDFPDYRKRPASWFWERVSGRRRAQ